MILRRLNNLPALLLGMKIYYSHLSVDGWFRRKTERILNIVAKKARRKDKLLTVIIKDIEYIDVNTRDNQTRELNNIELTIMKKVQKFY